MTTPDDRTTAYLNDLDDKNTKRNERIDLAEQFRRFAAAARTYQPLAGCDNLDNAVSRYEELRLLKTDDDI